MKMEKACSGLVRWAFFSKPITEQNNSFSERNTVFLHVDYENKSTPFF